MIPFFLGLTIDKEFGVLDSIPAEVVGVTTNTSDAIREAQPFNRSSSAKVTSTSRKVQFIPSKQLGKLDYFSGMFLCVVVLLVIGLLSNACCDVGASYSPSPSIYSNLDSTNVHLSQAGYQ